MVGFGSVLGRWVESVSGWMGRFACDRGLVGWEGRGMGYGSARGKWVGGVCGRPGS